MDNMRTVRGLTTHEMPVVFDFIQYAIRQMELYLGAQRKDIIILFPPIYERVLEQYYYEQNIRNTFTGIPKIKEGENHIFGVSTKFLSPTTDLYVFWVDYWIHKDPAHMSALHKMKLQIG